MGCFIGEPAGGAPGGGRKQEGGQGGGPPRGPQLRGEAAAVVMTAPGERGDAGASAGVTPKRLEEEINGRI